SVQWLVRFRHEWNAREGEDRGCEEKRRGEELPAGDTPGGEGECEAGDTPEDEEEARPKDRTCYSSEDPDGPKKQEDQEPDDRDGIPWRDHGTARKIRVRSAIAWRCNDDDINLRAL